MPFERVHTQIGKGGDQLMPVFLPPEEIERRGEEIDGYRKELFKRAYLPQARVFPRVLELVERVRAAGQRVVLASSGTAEEIDRYQELASIKGLIDAVATSDDAEQSKLHPDIFQAALAKVAPFGPESAVVVGDTPYDAQAARKIGSQTVGRLCGGFPEDLSRRFDNLPLAGRDEEVSEEHR